MRICIHKPTKHIIEMQSHATEGTLIQNAINAGFSLDDIEERVVDEAGYAAAQAEDTVEIAAKKERDEQNEIRALIDKKKDEMAIAELKKEGKLDANGKIPK